MDLEQLMGRHFRLRQALAQARAHRAWHLGTIDRLTAELAAVEDQLAGRQDVAAADARTATVAPSVRRAAPRAYTGVRSTEVSP